ncbi:hypothetical protein TBLA_0D04590 [Henningerozyma blattae CBS 6284]|uniref:BAG domain-containing protein n=1 Tax=Henningerozyma blattae (strain ATCC 34711 / CBS 6284 / DSM 70876 / NBRC 10599 / NRRL Y-10934 / UCD 77-7) TaxID=1071380 RepID=I2H3K3_HENB6|nr:hypothetical protein TBLA_0D04590 [Tetrapisispora blattae CBS 6284]CCH60955.1 hypothetical protein TBLA_0D04590 [Tetrapisispora blattae CBS 6284]
MNHIYQSRTRDSIFITVSVISVGVLSVAFLLWAAGISITGKSTIPMTRAPPKLNLKASKVKNGTPIVPELGHGERLQAVYEKFQKEYQKGIEELCSNFDHNDEKQEYQRNYFNEMLLKLLIQLDDVDLVNLEPTKKKELKDMRRGFIQLIQKDLKRLDSLKQ